MYVFKSLAVHTQDLGFFSNPPVRCTDLFTGHDEQEADFSLNSAAVRKEFGPLCRGCFPGTRTFQSRAIGSTSQMCVCSPVGLLLPSPSNALSLHVAQQLVLRINNKQAHRSAESYKYIFLKVIPFDVHLSVWYLVFRA